MAHSVNSSVSSSMYCPACGAANPVQSMHCFACGGALSAVPTVTGAKTNPLTGLLLPDVLVHQRYRILEVLSSGNISTVYKAQDIQLNNRLVTLKEVGQDQQSTQEVSELIDAHKREMFALAGLIHPNLPRIYEYFVENERWYFVMDFLEGETLEAYVRKRAYQPLTVEEVLNSGIQLATVLDYLRIRQAPYGLKDLEMGSIWRTPDGKLYLMDVGTTPPAVSSESRSIASLGRILRQLQAGKKSVGSLLHLALPKVHKRSRQSLPLKRLVRQMVHKKVHQQPTSMTVVKQELQQLVQQMASKPSPVIKQELQLLAPQQTLPSTPRPRRFSRRTLFRLGGLAGLTGLAAAGASLLTWQVLSGETRQVPHPGYSPNMGGTIYTYDASNYVLSVAWSPDGKRLVYGGHDLTVQAWEANTGQHVMTYRYQIDGRSVESVIWLPDGKSIAAGGDDALVLVWDAKTEGLRNAYKGHSDSVITLACSPDGQYIASGSKDQTVQVWEVATGRWVATYNEHTDGVGSVAWSPNGRYIASASFDKTVQIWEVATGRHIFTYGGHVQAVYAVAWSPDGQYIASGGKDRTVQVWPITLFEGNEQQQTPTIITYRGHAAAIQDLAWSPDSSTLASAADNVQLWNPLTGKHIFTYTKHAIHISLEVQSVAWSPNGRYIASGGMEGTVQVWNALPIVS